MALRHAVLAALLEGEASGYELAKRFDVSVANFWTASPQQLYRELERMEGDGVIAVEVVHQERRPSKRVVSLTASGREELAQFTARAPRPTAVRDELLVQLQAVDEGDGEAVAEAVRARVDASRAKLARYDALRERLLHGRTEEVFLREAKRVGPYLTLERGRAFERETIAWGEAVLSTLRRRSA